MASASTQIVAELRRRLPSRGYAKRVAHELGVSVNTIHAVASGKRAPSLNIAERLGFQLVLDEIRADEMALADRIEAEINGHKFGDEV